MNETYARIKEILLSFHDLFEEHVLLITYFLVALSACAWKGTIYAIVKLYDMREVCIKHYKHMSLR